MAPAREHDVTTPDGRTLRVLDAGAADGPVLVSHHGTPSARFLYRSELESADERALRLIAYDRPGYGGSTPARGRAVVDAAADVATILDALGVERFATYGGSGGGPHALACVAALPERCMAAVTLAGVAPADAPDLDWLAGMGEGNRAEMAAAREGRERLTEFCRADAAQMLAAKPEELAGALRPHLSDVDARALTGDLAEHLLASVTEGLRPGVEGWVDDDFAFLAPWGFDPGDVRVPVLVWQGRHDLMVPAAHGDWLRGHVAGAEGEVLEDEGHLTLLVHRMGDVHAWLQERLVPERGPRASV
jgi:pimeloyl-ACP methyl ester carboxylesterase